MASGTIPSGVRPIAQGGTGATTALQAITNLGAANNLDLGTITATSRSDAIGKAWDAITVYDKTVVGKYTYQGVWLFLAYKYTGSQYGMMIAITYNPTLAPWWLAVAEGAKTTKSFVLSTT